MKNNVFLFSIFSLVGMASAHAGEPVNGLYIGGSVGEATHRFSTSVDSVSITDKHDTALTLRSGYRFHPNWAIEGGYADLGKATYRNDACLSVVDVKARVGHIDAVAILSLADKISVFSKLGMAQMHYEELGYKWHKNTLHMGIGASYALAPALALRAEYDNYGSAKFSGASASSDLRSSQFSLGMDYRF